MGKVSYSYMKRLNGFTIPAFSSLIYIHCNSIETEIQIPKIIQKSKDNSQGLNPDFPHWRQMLKALSHPEGN